MGTSQAEKAISHDRILDIASAQIRRDGIDSLRVADLMQEAGLTTGGFYRHFDSREQLVAAATQRAMSQGSEWTVASGHVGGRPGYVALVDGYLSPWHRDHPEAGCGVAAIAADASRRSGSTQTTYTRQVKECLAVIADLADDPDHELAQREAVLTLSVLVGAISIARAVDDPDLSQSILADAAAALKERPPN
ncbi:MAG: TetR/AcrR family transcriptional regulator [Acidimicrobiales bacterium]